MEKAVHMGSNRTGVDRAPLQGKAMASGAAAAPASSGSEAELHELDKAYMRDAGALGSVPLPATLRGAFKALKDKLSGQHTEALLNKMGERLAFERSGVRLYESLIAKCEAADAAGSLSATVDLDLLRQFCVEEAQHFELLRDVLDGLGADATAQTPDADVAGIAAMGLMKVVQDPRISVTQSLEAVLSIELTDNAAWNLLVLLTREMGMEAISDRFLRAQEQEVRHLTTIRQWHAAAVHEDAGLAPGRTH